jgi:polar amino acid transport system substrate-binding protein
MAQRGEITMFINSLKALSVLGYFIIGLTLAPSPLRAEEDILRLATHIFAPYGSYAENATIKYRADESFQGMAVNRVRCALNIMEHPHIIYVVPWGRAQYMVRNNEADGFFAASHNKERDGYAKLSSTIADQEWQWFILKETSHNPSEADFKTKATFGGFRGANMLSWIEEHGYNVTLKAGDTEALLLALVKKRIDVAVANNHVMKALIAQNNLTDRIDVHTLTDKPVGVYFSKVYLAKHPMFLERFNHSVAECTPLNSD